MGKIILTMQMSLDGIVSNEDRWMSLSDEILEDYYEYYDTLDTIVVGGNTYASMAQYWQHAEKCSESALERSMAKRINDIPKIVISSTVKDLVWRNSRQIVVQDNRALVREMEETKKNAGKISVESGVKTWQSFIQAEIFDELWLFVHPAIASQGEKLFAYAEKPFSMTLSGSKKYENGVVGLLYRK
ncbi:deaminase [Paenibacillus hemerocallicola]|uniref:Deaminase n=1 Tax=Paenibacillus hemerocallicola TaxID=1172614 RepID=A0A5C4TFC4_9BACL|nr:dihydrofolate reductase family protein [Paenibacillus hemerocallicola]TNJ67247.1 deaminase [Paenibacillus hemerocallicola]